MSPDTVLAAKIEQAIKDLEREKKKLAECLRDFEHIADNIAEISAEIAEARELRAQAEKRA